MTNQRTALILLKLFDLWNLTIEEKLVALGLSSHYPSRDRRLLAMGKMDRMGKAMAMSRDLVDRAGNLLAIHKSLRLLFPGNPELRYAWMKTRNRAFHGASLIELVDRMGFAGLVYVRHYLDRAQTK